MLAQFKEVMKPKGYLVDKYLVKFYTKKSSSQLGLEIYAYNTSYAQREVQSTHPDAYGFMFENLSDKERQRQYQQRREEEQRQDRQRREEEQRQRDKELEERYRNKSTNPSESGPSFFASIGFLIKLALFAIAALIVLKIALYVMVVWEFLLYILIIVGFMVLIFKLKNNARKASMVFAVIAIPFMIFRMTQLADDYKEHFANEEKLRLERAEQKAKESKKTQTHEKAVSKEQKPVKNTGSN